MVLEHQFVPGKIDKMEGRWNSLVCFVNAEWIEVQLGSIGEHQFVPGRMDYMEGRWYWSISLFQGK